MKEATVYEGYKHTNIEDDPRILRLVKNQGRVMLEVVFDYHGVIHDKLISEGQTINKKIYLYDRLHNAMCRYQKKRRKKRSILFSQQFIAKSMQGAILQRCF